MSGPLIVQSDRTLLLESGHPDAQVAGLAIAPFAQLAKTPEYVHTYTITPLGLWNARASGYDAESVVNTLLEYAKFPVPHELLVDIVDTMDRFGVLTLIDHPTHGLTLQSTDPALLERLRAHPDMQGILGEKIDEESTEVYPSERGELKHRLLKLGHPVADRAGYISGEAHTIGLSDTWSLRDYQQRAIDAFIHGESGVVVLPCGAGKTVVGAATMAQVQTTTLILVTNSVSAKQWKAELLRRTSLTPEEIGEYSGNLKQIRPVTIATYQVLTTRRKGSYLHLELLDARNWGLVIYDEVHLLPAPVFRLTAGLQARRRLGLTATLVREDGREEEVFSLIGPKQFDVPWKEIEAAGHIATATCHEIRVKLDRDLRTTYANAEGENRYRLAASCEAKVRATTHIVNKHPDAQILVIGQYLDQLEELGDALNAPVLTGKTPEAERERLYEDFRNGDVRVLVVSKVANFSVDLPQASVAIQVSGSFGSRQEEAQRLGRILRPKENALPATFYTIVTSNTIDEDFAQHRRRFLTEQGYSYTIENFPGT
ncbi:DEAD/DEAH box helicase [Brevibacterium sp. ACRRH]|uniref:DNA repair helicase XPB n=1 Tax=Brevibacterium sp. ACRRH TaxID=2918183 RepID=UPI001EF579A0|nr:DNA repair helicase XPB [Brevibacterium sp. ACRRH]MCG7297702.1 DEAD/DEAH box helicase [Brevibacterium sp. ACRRH]